MYVLDVCLHAQIGYTDVHMTVEVETKELCIVLSWFVICVLNAV